MALIYPHTGKFPASLPPFALGNVLSLWDMPFDLDCDQLIGIDQIGRPLGGLATPEPTQILEAVDPMGANSN